jgi:hypothetical protein
LHQRREVGVEVSGFGCAPVGVDDVDCGLGEEVEEVRVAWCEEEVMTEVRDIVEEED